MVQNKRVIFKEPVIGWPEAGKNLAVKSDSFDLNQSPPPGGIITKNLYASLDPYMRGRLRDPSLKSYSSPYTLGSAITAHSIVQVLASDSRAYGKGDIIMGVFPLEEYSASSKAQVDSHPEWKRINNLHGLPLYTFLSALGMPGLTAYASLYEIGRPKKGETIFISSAAGAVGQVVGQLAKEEGLRVIGSVGDDRKLNFITSELGFDGGFNYKKETAADALHRLIPEGIDIYFDNVGGEQLDAALVAMNNFGRIVACGSVSQSSLPRDKVYGLKNIGNVVAKRIRMQGFIVFDENMGPKYEKERDEKVTSWLLDGSFKDKVDVADGIDRAVDALIGMLKGQNFGKQAVRIADA